MLAAIAIGAGTTGCSKKHTVNAPHTSAAYTTFETTCLGVEGDGTQTLRAWGKGSNKSDAIEQAKKTAVYDVIFKGIKGTGECNATPLVLEVNARERYANYFDPFFHDGGEYRKFVKEESAGEATRIKAAGTSITNYGIIVTVNRPKLRQQLIEDGVITE